MRSFRRLAPPGAVAGHLDGALRYEALVSFFVGLELVGPGITEAQTWRPWMPESVLRRRDGHVLAGVGRKPYQLSGASAEGSR
jgi:hypothetical protein